ncbi:hypothetical protein, partial [Frankia sp. Cr1]|uniref:hypothetical protein n=1 Tax=Frankia sp. Cr1 TaxID=3073931 RepID=UPI002AD2DB52
PPLYQGRRANRLTPPPVALVAVGLRPAASGPSTTSIVGGTPGPDGPGDDRHMFVAVYAF